MHNLNAHLNTPMPSIRNPLFSLSFIVLCPVSQPFQSASSLRSPRMIVLNIRVDGDGCTVEIIKIQHYIPMSSFPVRGTTKSKTLEDFDQNNHLDESLRLIDQLWNCRLIDHISRPIDKKIKLEHIEAFKAKMTILHERLKRIMNDAAQRQSNGNNSKGRSAAGGSSYKPKEWSKYIRGIENRYSEVLIEGSFKYFRKICLLLGLGYDSEAMEPINIERWSSICLNQKGDDPCC